MANNSWNENERNKNKNGNGCETVKKEKAVKCVEWDGKSSEKEWRKSASILE